MPPLNRRERPVANSAGFVVGGGGVFRGSHNRLLAERLWLGLAVRCKRAASPHIYTIFLTFALLLPGVALADQGFQASHTDRSGTITSGGVAQTLMAANTQRRGCVLQNQSTGDLWINAGGTAAATQPSVKVPPGAKYRCDPTGVQTSLHSIFGATTSQAFMAQEW